MAESVQLIPRELKELQFPVARFLTLEEQAKYEEACKSFGEKARNTLNVDLKGSNLFKVILLNQIGIKTATLPELDLIVENNSKFLEGTYEDAPSVVLRSAGDSYNHNDYVAKGLAKLIHQKKFPHSVIIEGLKLKEDDNSSYNLSFVEGENFKVIKAPDFDHKNNQRKFKKINPDYTIEFDRNGTRTLYTRDNGVSGLCFNRGLDLGSNDDGLADSNGDGRVVVVSGEATQNLDKYVSELQKHKVEQDKKLASKYKVAQDILDEAYNQAEAVFKSK
ncbi:MAG: hypothetical protein PHD81_01455 [Candidatus Nanoarchaeia archaeon]|nr:hypothetical protein [Candidatus Nanoarchaeia archaeon]MDD5587754.1 hypothetical protein [Candidatus Nanoarchaeia archaeon]